jgi:outer membrane protein OmpA-like peptidoglycan-associated protein
LEANQKVEITIQGYCSPLNYNLYNIRLGYRRVASLINYFYNYRNGSLQPYLKNKKLILKKQSFGEERAAKDVSDSREDTKNSVYNPKAAMERKVEIISVEIK